MQTFGTARDVWGAPIQKLLQAGLRESNANRLIEKRADLKIEKIEQELNEHEIKIVCKDDIAFPPLLKHLYDSPPALFYKGTLKENTFKHALAVVGSRKISSYGYQIITQIIPALIRAGVTIVSGMALGSDGFAHTRTLDAGGTTIAFLGSGIDDDSLYPRSHISLARRIMANNGAIISEFSPGTLPLRHHFPVRNRLIAGSTFGVLVTEAAEDSGSLITARLSLEYGRDVFAVPGSIHAPLSIGPNKLIQMGAQLVLNADDILNSFNLTSVQELPFTKQKNNTSHTPNEQIILDLLAPCPLHIDQLIAKSAFESKQVSTALTMLELNGNIKHIGNHTYALI